MNEFINSSLLTFVAQASFAQAHKWFNELSRFHSDKSQQTLHNMPFPYRLYPTHSLSATQLRQALQLILIKHQSLRTSLIFNPENNLLMQRIANYTGHSNKLFAFIESTFQTDEQLNDILHGETFNTQLFHLDHSLVLRCHIVYYKKLSKDNLLSDKDAIIFNFHHAFFDHQSMNIFLQDLDQAYTTSQLPANENTDLRYLDCKYQ
jgi:hypothetical protein